MSLLPTHAIVSILIHNAQQLKSKLVLNHIERFLQKVIGNASALCVPSEQFDLGLFAWTHLSEYFLQI